MPAESSLAVLDARLAGLREAAGEIRESLLELELDPHRELLERSPLEGESRARWTAASAAIADLWQCHGLLAALLERAGILRAGRRLRPDGLVELRALLEGRSIELSDGAVPLAERGLLGAATRRCSTEELLVRMSGAFEEAKAVVVAVGGAWETLAPRLDAAGRQLEQAGSLAGELGDPARAELEDAERRLAALRGALTRDPLGVAPGEVDALAGAVASIRGDLAATAELAGEFGPRLALARELLGQLRAAVQAGEAARAEAMVKIAAPGAEPAPAVGEELSAELERVAALGRGGAWREARLLLEGWTARAGGLLAEAQRILSANRAPIEARDQFRGLLEAYQVKAGRLGLLEDPGVAEIFARARQELYRAPTDLALVARLVRRYQEALVVPRAASEKLR
jgi:hypothetical protein